MKILMMTNTYSPHVGGVARSIESFARRYRLLGHHVKVVAPEFDGMPDKENDVIRIPAVRHFNNTDFSVALPVPRLLHDAVDAFEPDIVHSHHPFLIGGTGLRVAHAHYLPLVFTHHTKYEDYTHNVPGDSAALKRFVKNLATNYSNLCDQVIVPSESIKSIVLKRGVLTPVDVVPTGVDLDMFNDGDGSAFRRKLGIEQNAFVVGHLGRLTAEKNLPFLVNAIVTFLSQYKAKRPVHCLIVGAGPMRSKVEEVFSSAGLSSSLHMAGVLGEDALADAYHAMDAFAFASGSETQGMVLTEAMASGLPVVAVDAPGVREVVENGVNGHLLPTLDTMGFANALLSVALTDSVQYENLVSGARSTAERFSMHRTADTALELYSRVQNAQAVQHRHPDYSTWTNVMSTIESEWQLAKSTARSVVDAWGASDN